MSDFGLARCEAASSCLTRSLASFGTPGYIAPEQAEGPAANLTPAERAAATVYTSGEHCPMCAAAHGWVGLGRIVYVASSEQLAAWLAELGVPPPPVRTLPIGEVVPGLPVEGPAPELAEEVHDLHRRFHRGRAPGPSAS